MSLRERSTSSKETPKDAPDSPSTPTRALAPRPTSPSLPQRVLQSSANLANLLPTGTLLAFQLLTPIFTNNGACDSATRPLTMVLLCLLALSCFLACFTDSVKSSTGQVYYGFATLKGLWLFDNVVGGLDKGLPDLRRYRIGFFDVVHAVLSVMVFLAVALKDKNVLGCFYPKPDHETQEVLDIVPVGVGVICSLLFVVFPTRRNEIGYPVSREK